MKILMFASATPHAPLTHTPLAIGRELIKQGHEVMMLAPSMDKYSKWQIDRPETMYGVKMIYPYQFATKSTVLNLIPYILHGTWLVLTRKTDVAYVYKPTPASAIAVLAKWFRGAKLVLHTDDLDGEVMRAQGQPMPMWVLVDLSKRLLARTADGLIGASRLLEREFKAKYLRTPVLRIANGVDVNQFPLAPKAGQGRTPRIVFFGILGRTRILAPVIEALPKVLQDLGRDAIELEVLGDGPCRPELEALAKRLGVEANVHFRGWTTYDQLQDFSAAGDIGICIMPDERTTAACSNQKVFQYMSLGLATIMSNVGDLPLYANGGKAGLIVQDNADLVDAIEELITQPSKREQIAAEGRRQAETTYSWANIAGQVLHLLEQL